jgi:hypothetical protein
LSQWSEREPALKRGLIGYSNGFRATKMKLPQRGVHALNPPRLALMDEGMRWCPTRSRTESRGLCITLPRMTPPATLLMWFQLRSPELADDFERLMTEDRDIVRQALDTVSDWRLTQPTDVPGQAIGQADYVLIAEIVEVDRFEQQASEHIQRLADDLAHLVSSRGMLVVRSIL